MNKYLEKIASDTDHVSRMVRAIIARNMGATMNEVREHTRLKDHLGADDLDKTEAGMDIESWFHGVESPKNDPNYKNFHTVGDYIKHVKSHAGSKK